MHTDSSKAKFSQSQQNLLSTDLYVPQTNNILHRVAFGDVLETILIHCQTIDSPSKNMTLYNMIEFSIRFQTERNIFVIEISLQKELK